MRVSTIQSTMSSYNNPNFGRKIGGEDYPDKVILEAERLLELKQNIKPEIYKRDFIECLNDAKFQPLEWILSPLAFLYKAVGDDIDKPLETTRFALAISTLGLTELLKTPEAGIRKLADNIKVKRYVEQLDKCMKAIIRERQIKI